MERGGVSHKFILVLNIITLALLIGLVAINNLEINIGKLLLGFSASIMAITINGLMDKKISEPFYYLLVPFVSTALFIVIGLLTLNALTANMDFETLAAVNFAYTLIFAFIYFLSTKSRQININKNKAKVQVKHKEVRAEHRHKEINESLSHIKHEDIVEEEMPKIIHEKVVEHIKEDTPRVIEIDDKPRTDVLEELKKEFNIININQTSIIESLKELKASKREVLMHEILDKLEKDEIYFASVTGEKFHKPLCIVINHIHHDQIIAFKDEKEAVMEGYKPCKVCMPQD